MKLLRGWGAAGPGLTALLLLVALPALITLPMALLKVDGLSTPQFVGFNNFSQLWQDQLFWTSLSNSLKVAAVAVPLRLGLALLLALLLHRNRSGAGVARAAVLAPSLAPDMAWALVWLFILNPLYGPAAWVLAQFGLAPDVWLVSGPAARNTLAVISLWLLGELVVVLIAARKEIHPEIYEAAAMEGAGPWAIFCRITLPLILPVMVLLAARDAALSFQTSFTPALMITKGGPQFGSLLLPVYVYQNGFEYLRFGYAAALTLAMFAVTLLMIAVQLWWLKRWTRHGF